MMVDESIAEVIIRPPPLQTALLRGLFDLLLDDATFKAVEGYFFDDCIVIAIKTQNKFNYLRMNFSFDIIFDLLRQGQDRNVATQPYGFQFQKNGDHTLTLQSIQSTQQILTWRDMLQTKLNQRGFHQIFKPIKKIGMGNFASVYLAYKNQNNKKYAIKAFSKEAAYQQVNGKQSVINQITVMRQFNHKNLMKIDGVYQSQNSLYVSVELLEGGQLYDFIKQKYKFTSLEIKIIMKSILEGVEHMHSKGIMHRDLKPQNILLRTQGNYDCVIADFGLAEHAEKDQYLFVRCGTPGYVAPQVVNIKNSKAKYSPICDMFSVGVIFHMLIMKKVPFPGRECEQVLAQNRACRINFESHDYEQLPKTWLNLLKRMLQKDPKQRISATQALNHQYFAKDPALAAYSKERNSQLDLTRSDLAQQCQSPLMISKDQARKKQSLKRDDSCLKFKMNENLLTGRIQQKGDLVDETASPGLKKFALTRGKQSVQLGPVQSRFKPMSKE